MKDSQYRRQDKKSLAVLLLRASVGLAIIAASALGSVLEMRAAETGRVEIREKQDFSRLGAGTQAMVRSSDFDYSGLYEYSKNKNKPAAFFYFVWVETEVFVVKSKADYRDDITDPNRPAREFKGVLERNERWNSTREAFQEVYGVDGTAAQTMLPELYLNGGGAIQSYWWGVLPGALLVIVNAGALWRRRKNQARMKDYGVGEAAEAAFDEAFAAGNFERLGKVDLSERWLLSRAADNTVLLPTKEVVWIHKTITQHRAYGIPSGKTYQLKVFFSDGGTLSLRGKKNSLDGMQEAFRRRCPQAIVGYAPELEAKWKKDHRQVAAAARNQPQKQEETV